MSRKAFFTVDKALSEVLKDIDEEFFATVEDDSDRSDSNDDSACHEFVTEVTNPGEDSSDGRHFLDQAVDLDRAAAIFLNLSVDSGEVLTGADVEPASNVAEETLPQVAREDDSYFDHPALPPVIGGAAAAAVAVAPVPERTCGCSLKCLSQFSPHDIDVNIMNMAEMEKKEKDLMVLGLLEALRHRTEQTLRGRKRNQQHFSYSYLGLPVCVSAFRIIYDLGKYHMGALQKHLEENGLVPRQHGNTGRRPHNSLIFNDVKQVVHFLTRHAEIYGIPHPAPLRGRDEMPPVFLPASLTYKILHQKYKASCDNSGARCVGLSSFRSVRHRCLPQIKIMSPRADVCSACEGLRRSVMAARGEQQSIDATKAFTDHISTAQKERDFYKLKTIEAKGEMDRNPSVLIKPHYTFDFAQLVFLPHAARQEGPLYYKTPQKMQLFGVCCEAKPLQVNYLRTRTKPLVRMARSVTTPTP